MIPCASKSLTLIGTYEPLSKAVNDVEFGRLFCDNIDGTLTVRHVGEEHSGVYQCLARSSMSGIDVSMVTAGVSLVVTASAHTHSQQSLNPQHAGGYSLGIHTQLHALMRYRCSARVGSGVVRIDPLRFLAGCRKRRLNQALSVPSLSLGFLSVSVVCC